MADWEPIETAPKDGTPILACRYEPTCDVMPVVSCFWSRLSEGWFCEMAGRTVTPNYWMPLPAPPRMTSRHPQ